MVGKSEIWTDKCFDLDSDNSSVQSISGSYSQPTLQLGKIYNQLRVNHIPSALRTQFYFGDMFISKDKSKVRMVISQECDLIPRISYKGQTTKPKTERLLTVGGRIVEFNEDYAFVDELLMIDEKHLSAVYWNKKDLKSHNFPENSENSFNLNIENLEYIGTLRTQFARKIQHQVISDIGRVGLDVPPPIYLNSTVFAYLKKDPCDHIPITKIQNSFVSIILPIGSPETENKKLYLFDTLYVESLIEKLRTKIGDLSDTYKLNLEKLIEQEEKVRHSLINKGLEQNKITNEKVIVTQRLIDDDTDYCLNLVVNPTRKNIYRANYDVI